jgi:hypothetical protein
MGLKKKKKGWVIQILRFFMKIFFWVAWGFYGVLGLCSDWALSHGFE